EVGRVPGGNPLAQGVVRQGAVHGARVDVGEAELGGDAPGGARLSGAADAVDGDEGKHGGKINAKCEMRNAKSEKRKAKSEKRNEKRSGWRTGGDFPVAGPV